MLSYYSDAPVNGAFPSPTNSAFTNNLQSAANHTGQVAGTQTQIQQPPVTEPEKGPTLPTPKPSPSQKPSPTPSPSLFTLPSPSATPRPSPSQNPSPSIQPSPTPDSTPKITNLAEESKTDTSIKFKFTVDKSSDCKAIYWSDPGNKKEQESSTKRTTTPEITLTNLTPGTDYTYNIECKETDHNQTTTIGEYKFKTN